MTSASFARLAKVTASTKRNPLVGGVRAGYTTSLASLKVTPLAPLETSRAAELHRMLNIGAAFRLLECYAQGNPDVKENDRLVIGSKEYSIRAALPWSFNGDTRVNIIVEEARE